MVTLRPLRHGDLRSLYEISLATGHIGQDASALYQDGRMMGHIYSAPYAKLCPESCLVAADDQGVAGFAVGTLDTRSFEERLAREWWPALRAIYPDPSGSSPSDWNADQRRSFMIHHPRQAPEVIAGAFPAHLHINLLPRLQGQGIGSRLLDLWLSEARNLGAIGVHVGTNARNHKAIDFWERCGFARLSVPHPTAGDPVWLGRRIVRPVTD